MVADVIAGLGAFKTMLDIAKSMKDLDDKVKRNAAVSDLWEQITSIQVRYTTAIEQVDLLKKELANFETWDAESQRYELKDIGDGAVAYMLKPAMRGTEPPHWLCPNCYSHRKKSFYQPTGARIARETIYKCQGCQGNIAIGGIPSWED